MEPQELDLTGGETAEQKAGPVTCLDMIFVRKHLPDPFYLEGIERISIRDAIFREVASNILIHHEYTNYETAAWSGFE